MKKVILLSACFAFALASCSSLGESCGLASNQDNVQQVATDKAVDIVVIAE